MKFTSELNGRLLEEVEALDEVRKFTRQLYKLCLVVKDRTPIVGTACDFSRLSMEAIDSTRNMVESGFSLPHM